MVEAPHAGEVCCIRSIGARDGVVAPVRQSPRRVQQDAALRVGGGGRLVAVRALAPGTGVRRRTAGGTRRRRTRHRVERVRHAAEFTAAGRAHRLLLASLSAALLTR